MGALQRKHIRAISNAVGAASVFDVTGVSSRDLYFRRILGSNPNTQFATISARNLVRRMTRR